MVTREELQALIEHIARTVVDQPNDVRVVLEQGPQTSCYRIITAKSDTGKILGKKGSMADAIRKIAISAATKGGFRAVVTIEE